jgi:hypothetical protein
MEKYKDEEWLREKYHRERLSAVDMAELAGCTDETILRYMRKFDIPRRDMSTAVSIGKRRQHGEYVPLRTEKRGHVCWRGKYQGSNEGRVFVHRLAAVAWFGWDAVVDKAVHHKNNVPWDNREENLEPMTFSDHMMHHENWKYSHVEGDD